LKSVKPYSALAKIYDMVMEHVDYPAWADFVWYLIDSHLAKNRSGASEELNILELGAGTGLLTKELLVQGFGHVTVTDGSSEMLERAGERLSSFEKRIELCELDFEGEWEGLEKTYDVILLMYDGFNYARSDEAIDRILSGMAQHLAPDGIALFDQSTPANSINNAAFFEDEGALGKTKYIRKSSFDIEVGLHTTEFEITTPDGDFLERHVQRAWTRKQVNEAVGRSGLVVAAAYDGFSLDPADDDAERIHWVLKH